MKISLNEIPSDGRHYEFDRGTGELNEVLADLIDTRPYKVDFTIRPLGNAYELKGNVATTLPELCSRCGWDIEVAVDRAFSEILLEDQKEYRKSHSVHGNGSVDYDSDGTEVTFYSHDTFNAGDYIHEAIALAHPFYPTCPGGQCEHLDDVEKKRQELEREYQGAEEQGQGHPAFAVLKNMHPDQGKPN